MPSWSGPAPSATTIRPCGPGPDGKRNPWRVIVVRKGPLPLAQVFTDDHAPRTIVAAPKGWQPACGQASAGKASPFSNCRLGACLPALAAELGARGILRVLCEGGGILAGELLRAGLVDELCVFLSPMLIGGPVGATGLTAWPLPRAPRFTRLESRPVGKDWFLRFVPAEKEA
jgi:riboflavin biosynthesis pyrimidine reductase